MRPLSQPLHELLPAEVILLTHAPILESRIITWPDEAACAAFAQRLSGKPELREAYVELHGALGAGKTTLLPSRDCLHSRQVAEPLQLLLDIGL